MRGRILRGLASALILALLALDVWLPRTALGRRGREAAVRSDAVGAVEVGQPLPDLALRTWDGAPARLSDLHGHRVLLTFERSVDW